MSHKLIIRPEAEAELAEQFDWYEERKQGLGQEFLDEIRAVLLQIEGHPGRHAEVIGKLDAHLSGGSLSKSFILWKANGWRLSV